MFSIYTTAFNLDKGYYSDQFLEDAVLNFSKFAEEVVISVPSDEKNSKKISILEKFGARMIYCDTNKEDILFVGKLKNCSLQSTTLPAKIGLDLDERIPLWHYDRWVGIYDKIKNSEFNSAFIHSLDLWGRVDEIKKDLSFYKNKFKWYLHEDNLFRGVVNFGKNNSGSIDIKKTDTCELIDASGNLANFAVLSRNNFDDIYDFLDFIENDGTFVYHLGYADLDDRININKGFWNDFKTKRNGGEEPFDIKTNKEELKFNTIKHNLKLWNE